ncbi:MAG: DUF1492 domain-containing protein [Pseudomonadota bacterium]
MSPKEYLSQARWLDMRINSKLLQVESLHSLATKATSTLSDAPHNENRNVHRMEEIIFKIIALENEINENIDKLVDLKRGITECIQSVENMEYQSLLEKRYLCLMTWEQIAAENGCSVRNIHLLHGEALKKVTIPENLH